MTPKYFRKAGAAAAALLICAALAGCAPEPGTEEYHGKNPIEAGEAKHPDPPEEAFEKNVELPESFPAAFPQPEGLSVDDTGEREPGTWFIVYRADSQAEADAAWESVIEQGGFTVSDSSETTEGGISATLSNQDFTVFAVTIPGAEEDSVLLTYDIAATAQ